MELNGHQIAELTRIISAAFTPNELSMLTQEEFDTDLYAFVSLNNDYPTIVRELINALIRRGRAVDLVRAIREARSGNTALCAFCDAILAGEPVPPGGALPGNSLGRAIAEFNEKFQERAGLFRFLAANKALHDVLHELDNNFRDVATAVGSRVADHSVLLSGDVIFILDDNLAKAQEYANETEFPDAIRWIPKLVAIIQALKGAEFEKMPKRLELLKKLPSDELRPLNDELFKYASRLEPQKLIGSLDAISAAMGARNDAASATLRGQVQGFRKSCYDLHELITAHNLCQKIDDALREAAGLPTVTASDLSEWDLIMSSLAKLALCRKDDMRVQRTNEAASQFKTAPGALEQAETFANLMAKFQDLFKKTDEALLRVTNRLPPEAIALRSALEHIQ